MRRHGLENLAVTGKVEGTTTARGRQRLKYLDSLSTCWKDNMSPTQLIRASEDRELWHHMVANVVYHGTAHQRRKKPMSHILNTCCNIVN